MDYDEISSLDPRYPFALAFSTLSITIEIIMGFSVIVSSWDIVDFTWISFVPCMQLFSGVSYLLVINSIWKAVLNKYNYSLDSARIGVTRFLNISGIAVIVNMIVMFVALSRNMDDVFMDEMKSYSSDEDVKVLIDDIQITFRCCGAAIPSDWFYTNWQNIDVETNKVHDISTAGWDAVPFSCCSKDTTAPCVYQELSRLGYYSIHNNGCSSMLNRAVATYLSVCVMISIMTFLATLWLLLQFKFARGSKEYNDDDGNYSPPRKISETKDSYDSNIGRTSIRSPDDIKKPDEPKRSSSSSANPSIESSGASNLLNMTDGGDFRKWSSDSEVSSSSQSTLIKKNED